jgi:WD40 repeat protein
MLTQAPIYALCFSVEGRFLASAGADSRVLMWDLAHGHLLAELTGHKGPIHTLAFSRDGHILTSGNSGYSDMYTHTNMLFVVQDSIVSIVTSYRLDNLCIKSWWGQIFLHPSRPAVGPTQTPVKWIHGLFPKGTAPTVWHQPPTRI